MSDATDRRPRHPFWCDECGGKAPFRIKGCTIDHRPDCQFYGETSRQAERLHEAAVAWLRQHPGEKIP